MFNFLYLKCNFTNFWLGSHFYTLAIQTLIVIKKNKAGCALGCGCLVMDKMLPYGFNTMQEK